MARGRRRNNDSSEQADRFRAELRELRLALRMTVAEFAIVVGVVPNDVVNRERGRSSWSHGETTHAKRKVMTHLSTFVADVSRQLATLPD